LTASAIASSWWDIQKEEVATMERKMEQW